MRSTASTLRVASPAYHVEKGMGMSSGPEFETAWEHIESGFRRIATGLDMKGWQQADLLHAIGDGHRSGDDRKLVRLCGPALAEDDWSWPWFDECASALEQASVWPFLWNREGIRPSTRWHGLPRGLQRSLLVNTIVVAALTDRNLAQYKGLEHALRLTLRVNDERCPAEAHFCKMYRAAIEAGDFSNIPPYYPACGVWIRTSSRSGRW